MRAAQETVGLRKDCERLDCTTFACDRRRNLFENKGDKKEQVPARRGQLKTPKEKPLTMTECYMEMDKFVVDIIEAVGNDGHILVPGIM